MRVIFFLKIFKIKSKFRISKKKILEMFFVFEIIAYEILARNVSIKKIILVIGSQWVNKQS